MLPATLLSAKVILSYSFCEYVIHFRTSINEQAPFQDTFFLADTQGQNLPFATLLYTLIAVEKAETKHIKYRR